MAGPGGRGGREVGRTTVRVVPDSTRTRQDLKKALERIERTTELRIRATVDTDQIRRELNAAARDVRAEVRLDTTQAVRQFVLVWRAFQDYARRNPIPVDFAIQRAQAEASLASLLRDRTITVTTRTRGTGVGFLDRLLSSGRRNPFVRLTSGLGDMARTAGLVAVALAGLSAALVSTVQLTGGLVFALVQMSGIVALLPALSLAGAAGLGTLALAFTGLADAGGAAGQVRRTVRGLADELQSLRGQVQDNFFDGLARPIRDLVQGWLPVLSDGLGGIASQLNTLASGMLGVLSSQQSLADGATGLANTEALFAGLAAAAPLLTAAFRDIAAVGSTFLPELGAGIAGAAADFAAFIAEARASGELEGFIQTSIDAVRTFGNILLNVGQAFGGIFTAANASGAGFLSSLEDITNTFLNVVMSPGAQSGLAAFFTSAQTGLDTFLGALSETLPGVLEVVGPLLGTLTESVGLVLGAVVRAIAPVIEILAPVVEQLASTLGASFAGLVSALAPSLQAVAGALVPVVQSLGENLAPVLAAAAPVLGELAVAVAEVFGKLAVGLIPAIADVLLELLPAVQELVPVLGEMALTFVDELLPVLPDIVDAIVTLAPAISELAQQLTAAMPTIAAIAHGFFQVIAFLTTLQDGTFIAGWIVKIQDKVAELAADFNGFLTTARAVWGGVQGYIGEKVGQIVALGGRVVGFKDTVLEGFTQLRDGATGRLTSLVETVRGLPGQVMSALGDLGSTLYNAGRELISGLIEGITSRVAAVRTAVSNIASTIKNHFPGSPVKTGPLTSWNNGGAGARLGDLLADGLRRSQTTVRDAAAAVAGTVAAQTAAANLAGGLTPALAGGSAGGPAVVQHITATPNQSPYEVAAISNRLATFGKRP